MSSNTSTPRRLQFFRGHIVDQQHREFQYIGWKDGKPGIEYISFASNKGRKLLRAWKEARQARGTQKRY